MFTSTRELDELLSEPSRELIELFGRIEGDLVVLGAGGKMGVTLALLAARAARESGAGFLVTAVSRFTDRHARETLQAGGVRTMACDLLDPSAVRGLPTAEYVVYMAGRKFGTAGSEPLTWAANTVAPALAADRYRGASTVAFSTGCVYPLVAGSTGGCTESTSPSPVGEYAQSCLGRERVFEYFSETAGTPVCLLRLNYAIDLRYGVLHDIAARIARDEPVDLSSANFNCIWQGDANRWALLALERCTVPASVLNITGPDTVSTRDTAIALGLAMGKEVRFTGEPGPTAYLSDASLARREFGAPEVSLDQMIEWTAAWVRSGMPSLGKPTHFEVRDGGF